MPTAHRFPGKRLYTWYRALIENLQQTAKLVPFLKTLDEGSRSTSFKQAKRIHGLPIHIIRKDSQDTYDIILRICQVCAVNSVYTPVQRVAILDYAPRESREELYTAIKGPFGTTKNLHSFPEIDVTERFPEDWAASAGLCTGGNSALLAFRVPQHDFWGGSGDLELLTVDGSSLDGVVAVEEVKATRTHFTAASTFLAFSRQYRKTSSPCRQKCGVEVLAYRTAYGDAAMSENTIQQHPMVIRHRVKTAPKYHANLRSSAR